MIDVELARSLTPACANVHHFNNAGSSPSPAPVLETVVAHLQRESEIGGYEAAAEARERYDAVYQSIARLLNGAPDEVALVENATRAWDMAFYGLRFDPGDVILTGHAEYASNLIALLQVAERTGAVVEVIDDDESGQISLELLAERLDDDVKLISLTHVPTSGGLVSPAEDVGRLAKQAGIPFMLDACQSAGQLVLDVERLGCDVLTATGRKFLRAPRGTGFAWVRRDFVERIDPPLLDLHAATLTSNDAYEVRSDARRLENWESSIACRLGLGAAVDYAMSLGLDQIEDRVTALGRTIREGLSAVPGVTVHDQGARRCGIVTFSVAGRTADEVATALGAQRVNTSVSRRGDAVLDLGDRGLPDVVRASGHYFNDDRDVAALIDVVDRLPASAQESR